MIAYGLGVLALSRELREAHPKFTQPWYAENSGVVRTLPCIFSHLENIMAQGQPRGYLPDPTNSILFISTHNFKRAESFLNRRGPTIFIGSRYLGGLHWGCITLDMVAEREGAGLDGRGQYNGGGGAQEPAGLILRPVEVPPTEVGLCAMRHPVNWHVISGSGGCAAGRISPGPLSGGHVSDPLEVNHWYAG